MTLYVSLRSQGVGGEVVDPRLLEDDGSPEAASFRLIDLGRLGALVAGRNIVFAAHGFNVSLSEGARSLRQLEAHLELASSSLFFGLLWPGDYWLPVLNYPFEGEVAMDCGRRLATFCAEWLSGAQSLSFLSHSLGARLVLEAVRCLPRRARLLCLTAGAVNRDCLSGEYAGADANSADIRLLASRSDRVLKLAYPLGDPIADLLHHDHALFTPALGYNGPPTPAPAPVASPWQIADGEDYGHGDYFPPGEAPAQAATAAKWLRPARFMASALRGRPQDWP